MSPTLRQLNMRAYKATHGETGIPKGVYCYEILSFGKGENGMPVAKTRLCPYWDRDESKPEQSNGYCWYIEKGDWEEDGTFLLWDQCKECGINDPDYDPCEEED